MARELDLGSMLLERGRALPDEELEQLARNRNVLAALLEAALAALFLEHGFEQVEPGDRRGVRRADRVRGDPARRLQDRAPGGAGAPEPAGELLGARDRGPGARAALHVRGARSTGTQLGRGHGPHEEGGRAGGGRGRRSRRSRPSSRAGPAEPAHPPRSLACPSRAPERNQAARLQVVPRPGRSPARAGRGRRRRAERLGEVEHRRRAGLGGRVAGAQRAARREAGRRALRRLREPGRGRLLRGRAAVRQRGRRAGRARLRGGLDRAPAAPRRRGAVPRQRREGAAHGRRRAARRRRPRPAMGSIVAQGKVEAILSSKPEERRDARRGGGRPRALQAPPPPRRAEARARRDAGRARPRPRGGGRKAAAAARAPGDRGRARGEARRRDRVASRAGWPRSISRTLDDRIAGGRERAEGDSTAERARRRGALEALLAERERAEEELAAVAGGREGAAAALYRLRSARERLEMRREAAAELLERLRETPPLRSTARPARAGAARRRAGSRGRAGARRARGAAAGRARARRAGRAAGARPVDVEPGTSGRSRRRSGAGAAVVARRPRSGLALLEQRALRRARQPRGPRRQRPVELVRSIAVVPLDELLASREPAVTARASATTRSAASCGSPARRPRRSCSSWRPARRLAGGGRARARGAPSQAAAARRPTAAGRRCRGGR